MSEAGDGSVVGVVGDPVDRVRAAAEATGARAVTGAPDAVLAADLDVLVTVGPRALSTLVAAGVPSAPVLPVAAESSVPALPLPDVDAGVRAVFDGEFTAMTMPVLGVALDGDRVARAVADVMLVTAEPARISEYTVATDGRTVADFRADGVVAATPLGSHGYARRVDGPVVAPDTGVAAVVPVAPFATDADHWVLPLDAVTLRVARDEHAVELHADHRTVGPVDPHVAVTLDVVATLTVAVVPGSQGPLVPADGH